MTSTISSSDEVWSSLEKAPLPSPIKLSNSALKLKLSKQHQQRVDSDFWKALDENNLENVKKALNEGARIDIRRKAGPAVSALYVAFEKNNQEMAKLLIEHGANTDTKGTSKQSLVQLAIQNDAPELLEQLREKGLDVLKKVEYFANKKYIPEMIGSAPKIIKWWLENDFPLSFKHVIQGNHNEDEKKNIIPAWIKLWTSYALKFNQKHFDLIVNKINQEYASEWNKTSDWMNEVTSYWVEAFHKDDVEKIQFMVKQKWTPHLNILDGYHHESRDPEYKNIFWKATQFRAFRCMEFLLVSPKMKELVQKDLMVEKPKFLLRMIPIDVEILERLLLLGLDLKMSNEDGTLFHHQHYLITKKLAEWLIKKDPDLFWIKNKKNETILNGYNCGGVTQEWVDKTFLKRTLKKASRKNNKPKNKARL